jgi:hypothetical protein
MRSVVVDIVLTDSRFPTMVEADVAKPGRIVQLGVVPVFYSGATSLDRRIVLGDTTTAVLGAMPRSCALVGTP